MNDFSAAFVLNPLLYCTQGKVGSFNIYMDFGLFRNSSHINQFNYTTTNIYNVTVFFLLIRCKSSSIKTKHIKSAVARSAFI